MHRLMRNPILILLLGLVLLAPLFELFDQSQDLEQGNDLVLAFMFLFVATGLLVLCKSMTSFLFRSLRIATILADISSRFSNRPTKVNVSPPESLLLLGSLRI